MRLRPAMLGRVAVALPLLALCVGSAAAQGLVRKTYLSAALAHEALTTAVETSQQPTLHQPAQTAQTRE